MLAAACGGDDSGSAAEGSGDAKRIGLVYDVGGLGDQGFNDAALVGLTRVEDELGLRVQTFETDDTGSDREDLLRLLAGDGFGLVIGVGAAFGPAVDDVAPDYPGVSFAIVDDDGTDLPNVTSLVFADEQGAYLVGAAAALLSPSHHLGFVGGQDDERTRRAQAGFIAGARRVVPLAKVEVAFLPAPAEGAAIDPALVRDAALAQYAAGADVLFGAPAGVSSTLVAAATERGAGAKAIGFGRDLAASADPAQRGAILTSMVQHVDLVVFDVIQLFAEGGLDAGTLSFGVPDGALDASATGGSLPADVQNQLDDLEAQLVAGQIQVPSTPS